MTTPTANDDALDAALLALTKALTTVDHPVKAGTAAWAREHLAHRDLVAADDACAFPAEDWARCAERGLFRLLVPIEYGGAGPDRASALLTLEGLGLGCPDNGLTYAVASQVLSTQIALVRFGSDQQRARWLPGLLDGTVRAAFAMTEPDSGSDAFSMAARAERLDDGSYRLRAHKTYITFAPECDMAIVFAATRPNAGSWGISAFVVDAALDGVERSATRPKMGMRTTPFGDLRLHDVVVPPDALLGREGAGASIFGSVLDVERAYVCAPQIGAMERQLIESIEYARQREQGGQPIGAYQAVSHRIVAMRERHERARLFLYRAAMAELGGTEFTSWAALAKIVAGDTGLESALDATAVQGARGYVSEYEVERGVRDAVGGLVYSGTPDVLRNLVARLHGVG